MDLVAQASNKISNETLPKWKNDQQMFIEDVFKIRFTKDQKKILHYCRLINKHKE